METDFAPEKTRQREVSTARLARLLPIRAEAAMICWQGGALDSVLRYGVIVTLAYVLREGLCRHPLELASTNSGYSVFNLT